MPASIVVMSFCFGSEMVGFFDFLFVFEFVFFVLARETVTDLISFLLK